MKLRQISVEHRATVLRVLLAAAIFALAFIVSAYVGRGSPLGFFGTLGGCGVIALWVTRGPAPAARTLLAAGFAVGTMGALLGMFFGDAAFPNYLIAIGVTLFGAAIAIESVDWPRIRRALRAARDVATNRPGLSSRPFVTVSIALLAISTLAVLAATVAPNRVWPFELIRFALGAHLAYGNPLLLRFGVVVDAILGAFFVYALLRPRHGRGAALFAALLWMIVGPRIAIVWLLPLPTFVVPAFAYALTRLLAHRSAATVSAVVVIAAASAAFSPALALAQLVLVFAMSVAARGKGTIAPVILSLIAGTVGYAFHLAPHPMIASMVSPHLDLGLRMTGADGSWPWELLYPAVDSAILQSLTPAILTGIGRGGNVLVMSCGIGWGVLLLAVAAWSAKSRAVARESQWWLTGLIAVVLALPSHAYGVPLPTPAEFIQLLGGSADVTPIAAKLLLAIAVTMLAGGMVSRIVLGGNPVALPIAALLLFAMPATSAFSIDTRTASSSASLAYAARRGAPLLIAPSYERGDWAWRYADYASRGLDRRLIAIDAATAALQMARRRAPATLLLEDPAAARARIGGPFGGLAIVPAAFEASSDDAGPLGLTACVGGYSLVRLFPAQGVYARKPACRS